MTGTTLIRRTVKLNLSQGLHLRACSMAVALVGKFDGEIKVRCGERCADASSMFDLVHLAAAPGADLILEGDGEGAEPIIDALEQLFSRANEADE